MTSPAPLAKKFTPRVCRTTILSLPQCEARERRRRHDGWRDHRPAPTHGPRPWTRQRRQPRQPREHPRALGRRRGQRGGPLFAEAQARAPVRQVRQVLPLPRAAHRAQERPLRENPVQVRAGNLRQGVPHERPAPHARAEAPATIHVRDLPETISDRVHPKDAHADAQHTPAVRVQRPAMRQNVQDAEGAGEARGDSQARGAAGVRPGRMRAGV